MNTESNKSNSNAHNEAGNQVVNNDNEIEIEMNESNFGHYEINSPNATMVDGDAIVDVFDKGLENVENVAPIVGVDEIQNSNDNPVPSFQFPNMTGLDVDVGDGNGCWETNCNHQHLYGRDVDGVVVVDDCANATHSQHHHHVIVIDDDQTPKSGCGSKEKKSCCDSKEKKPCCSSKETKSCGSEKKKPCCGSKEIKPMCSSKEKKSCCDSKEKKPCCGSKETKPMCSSNEKKSCCDSKEKKLIENNSKKAADHSCCDPKANDGPEEEFYCGTNVHKCSEQLGLNKGKGRRVRIVCCSDLSCRVPRNTIVCCRKSFCCNDKKVAIAPNETVLKIASPGSVKSEFWVEGICCSSEVVMIERVLNGIKGIDKFTVNVVRKIVIVTHDNDIISCDGIVSMLNDLHLNASIKFDGSISDNSQQDHNKPKNVHKYPKWYMTVALILWLLSLLQYIETPDYMENFKYLAIGSVVLCFPNVLINAYYRLKRGQFDIQSLMSIATIGALALGEYSEAAAVVTLFSLSTWLEERVSERVHTAYDMLLSMSPETAILAEDKSTIGVEQVVVGTRLCVPQGEKFPIDGKLVQGETFVDESSLTGESLPVGKKIGDEVFGGTLNVGPYIEMETTKLAEDSSVAKIVKLIEEAQSKSSPTQQIVEKVAAIYTPIVVLVALLFATIPFAWGTDVGKEWVKTALVILIVACPCALVISTPITYAAGLAQAARKGILVKGGRHLETLGRVTTLALDKSGTLTEGNFTIVEMKMLDTTEYDENQIWMFSYVVEGGSTHPISTAFCDYVEDKNSSVVSERNYQLVDLKTIPGQGIVGNVLNLETSIKTTIHIGNSRMAQNLGWVESEEITTWENNGLTASYIGINEKPVAIFCAGDTVRAESSDAVYQLGKLGIEMVMLTGDNSGAANAVCNKVGINEFHASLLPSDKVEHVEKLPGIVAMVGDGINDAAALARVNVSISLGCVGSAVALEAADVALMQDDLLMIPQAIRLGRLTLRKIIQNVVFSLIMKGIVLIITLVWVSSLWFAIIADVGSMLAVTFNSMRILQGKRKKKNATSVAITSE